MLLKRNRSVDLIPENTTFVLIEDDVCNSSDIRSCNPESELEYKQCSTNGCGLKTQEVKDRLSLNESSVRKVEIGNHNYSIYS